MRSRKSCKECHDIGDVYYADEMLADEEAKRRGESADSNNYF